MGIGKVLLIVIVTQLTAHSWWVFAVTPISGGFILVPIILSICCLFGIYMFIEKYWDTQ